MNRITSLPHKPTQTATTGCAIAVMGKIPRAGRSRTRRGADGALRRAFLQATTDNIASAAREAPIRGNVAYAPADEETELQAYQAAGTELLFAAGAGPIPDDVDGFGRSAFGAVRDLLSARHHCACAWNSDGPIPPTAFLDRAAVLLTEPGNRAMPGPADDGGNDMLGLKRPDTALFRDIGWITADAPRVRAASLRRLGATVVDPLHSGFAYQGRLAGSSEVAGDWPGTVRATLRLAAVADRHPSTPVAIR